MTYKILPLDCPYCNKKLTIWNSIGPDIDSSTGNNIINYKCFSCGGEVGIFSNAGLSKIASGSSTIISKPEPLPVNTMINSMEPTGTMQVVDTKPVLGANNALKCEMCNSVDVIKENGLYICQNCGTKYSIDEAKKIMFGGKVDISGSSVKIDTSDEIIKLCNTARIAYKRKDTRTALRCYESVLDKEPFHWEAYFFSAICKAERTSDDECMEAIDDLHACFSVTCDAIKQSITDKKELEEALELIVEATKHISEVMTDKAEDHMRKEKRNFSYDISNIARLDISSNDEFFDALTVKTKCESAILRATHLTEECANAIEESFKSNKTAMKYACILWKEYIENCDECLSTNAQNKLEIYDY